MSRRIQTGLSKPAIAGAAGPAAPGAGSSQEDDYFARLAKYIPSEILALYLAMSAAVPQNHATALWIVFALNLLLVPIYMWIVTSRDPGKGPLVIQVVLATIAFPVWVFAMGPPFSLFSWYLDWKWLATILLMFSTVVFGLIRPAPGT